VTTVVDVMSTGGVPTYTIHEPAAWDCMPSCASLELAAGVDVVCFGTLAQRQAQSREAIHTFLAHTPVSAWRVLDVNFRLGIYTAEIIEQSLAAANVLKINDDELEILRTFYELPAGEEAALRVLAERFELQAAVLTRGAAGSLAISGAASSEQSVVATEIIDTVGAGDAFGAAFVVALEAGQPLDDAHALAAQVAGFVCSQSGAMSPLPKEVLRQWNRQDPRT
ncbi:MAG: PfkB family carbohydrate kinase, partial [Lentisphaeria bacterium]